jgi:stress response protein SCP2
LSAGTYPIYLYADPTCLGAESFEDNNAFGPITVVVGVPVDVTIAGNAMGSYFLPVDNHMRVNYAGIDSGPVKVQSVGGTPIVAGLRELWSGASSFQLMGLPESLLTDTYVFPSYNNVTLDEQLRFGNVGTSPTTVTVTIGGVEMGSYVLQPSQQQRVNYVGVDSGPIVVHSSGGVPIISSLRDAWLSSVTGVESFAQMMGLPQTLVTDTYMFPSYNNVTLDEQLRFGNVGSSPTTVTVTIGGVEMGSYVLQPSQQQRVNYAGVDSGPVVIHSSGGVPIIAALRGAWLSSVIPVESWVQLMGFPSNQLSDAYAFPAYDNVTLDGQLRFGNVGSSPTTVTVTIGGVEMGSYVLQPNQQQRVNYAGVNSGPVEIRSSGGVPIIAALRDALIVNGTVESFTQMMGLPIGSPNSQLSDTYLLPSYNNVTLDEQLRFGVP